MSLLRKYVANLSDETRLEILKNFDQFERDGFIGDCTLRGETNRFMITCLGEVTGMSPVIWMNQLTAEIWRFYAMSYIRDNQLLGK